VSNRSQPNASQAEHGPGETDPLEPPARQRWLAGNVWCCLRQWMRANTFAPSWLPTRLRHPALGYVAAVILEVIAVALTLLLIAVLPAFSLPGLLVVLVVVLVALNWGGGPSLLATLVGGALLDFVVFPYRFGWSVANVAPMSSASC